MRKLHLIACMACLGISLNACKSAPETTSTSVEAATAEPVAANESASSDAPVTVTKQAMFDNTPVVIDLGGMTDKSVTPYTLGTNNMQLSDILPVRSDSSGYVQKWEFYLYSEPYSARLKFEISNFAFSKNEAKVKGYVQKHDANGDTVNEYKISKTYKSGSWKTASNELSLDFGGEYSLKLEDGVFKLHGVYEKGSFDYEIEPNFWKPGSGNVYFGDDSSNVFKYSVMAYHKPLLKGVVTHDGESTEVTGTPYANHYMTNVAVYEMFNELSDFRKIVDDNILVEFRYYVPSDKYENKPFGFMFVAYDGVPVISSTNITRTPLETWVDDGNYNYQIDVRQQISAEDDGNRATFTMLKARATGSDPYADLPSFQRAIAMRFAKPVEYNVKIDWTLDLDVDGFKAKIPYNGTYSLTRMH